MGELEPYSTEAHYRKNIANDAVSIVDGEQAVPVVWYDDRGTMMELVLDGPRVYFSSREVGVSDVLSITLDRETGEVSATGTAIEDVEHLFDVSKEDAAIVFMIGGLTTKSQVVHKADSMQILEPKVGDAAELQPIPEPQLWDRITAIEQMTYEYDPDGYPANAKDRTAWVGYGNADKYMVDTLSYYETEDRKYLPQITTQWVDPTTFKVLATDQVRLVDDGVAQRVIEPYSVDTFALESDSEAYAHLSFAIENMFNVLHGEHAAGNESPEL